MENINKLNVFLIIIYLFTLWKHPKWNKRIDIIKQSKTGCKSFLKHITIKSTVLFFMNNQLQ